jgi:hypothetical protein
VEIPRISAVSSTVQPKKKRSSTMRVLPGSSSARSSRARERSSDSAFSPSLRLSQRPSLRGSPRPLGY